MTAIKFLGASVRYYNSVIGWGQTPSELIVGLAEDDLAGDVFSPPLPGAPVYFEHGNFKFGGILQHQELQRGEGGAPVYEVSVYDPRIILEGVQLILNGYTDGVYNMPNLLNIYGYYENTYGFGSSEINESGMPWLNIVNGLGAMFNGLGGIYGGAINYRGYFYNVVMSPLPSLPESYRVGGTSISLLNFIQEICEAGNLDWFCTLQGQQIYIQTINRTSAFTTFGAITNYAATVGANRTNAGLELMDNVTGKFLIGGPVDQIYYNFYQDYGNDTTDYGAEDNTIWPFWGFDGEQVNGGANVIMGQGTGDDHRFVVDARSWEIYGIPDWYETNILEMRAALDSQETWEAMLWLYNDVQGSPQYHRAQTVGIIGDANQEFKNLVNPLNIDEFDKLTMMQFQNLKSKPMTNVLNFDHQKNIKKLYDLVRTIAEENYGRKWMVRIPFVYAANVPETDTIKFSQNPTDSGYIDEAEWIDAIGNGLLPYDVTRFTDESNKFTAFVRFDNAIKLDFSDISDDDKYIAEINNQLSVFVRCEVDPNIVFLNKEAAFSPRVVITLPGVVRIYQGDDNLFAGFIYDYLLETVQDKINDAIQAGNPNYTGLTTQAQVKQVAKTKVEAKFRSIGSDSIQFSKEAAAVAPDMVAIPLRDNTMAYGPWFSLGATGKVEFEVDESLVPWNYGSFTLMNEIGSAKVQEVYSNQTISETGSVTFAGAPEYSLGNSLTLGGPAVSDISCSIGQDGITTTYNMKVFTPDFGKLRRYNIDRTARMAKVAQQFRRRVRELYFKSEKQGGISDRKTKFFKSIKAKRDKSNSSHLMLCGEMVGASGTGYSANVASQPPYNTVSQLGIDYEHKGGMSLDGMFRPFSTNPDASGIPHYESPTGSGTGIDCNDLNPFKSGHDIQCIVNGSGTVPDDLVIPNLGGYYPSEYRPIALRGPLVISGWGYDINEDPVPSKPLPSGQTTKEFVDNVLQRSDLWKTGPVDIRWDDDRKVWVASGGGGSKLVKVLSTGITAPSGAPSLTSYKKVYKCQVATVDFDDQEDSEVSISLTSDYIYAGNFRDISIITDKYYLVQKVGSKYLIDSQADFVND